MGWSFPAIKLRCGFWLRVTLDGEGAGGYPCLRMGMASVSMQFRPGTRESKRYGSRSWAGAGPRGGIKFRGLRLC